MRRKMARRVRSIVIGIAETHGQDPHLAPAIRLAEALGATLHVVHALRLPDPILHPYADASVFSLEAIQQIQEGARTRLEAQARKVSASERILCRAVPVPADAAILDVAKEAGADLIVVGSTRRGTLARTILGTTAQRVVHAARIPRSW